MRIVCLSDTHNRHLDIEVPEGDLVVHAGDATARGTQAEIEAFVTWFDRLPHRHKVVIAGNHDWGFERHPDWRTWFRSATYLENESAWIEGLHLWGSPFQPWFHDWAFQRERGAPMQEVWDQIPNDVDVLITHGPPHKILDLTVSGDHAGCEALTDTLARVRPKLHIFGHIHEAYGEEHRDGIHFVNACTCSLRYEPTQPPIVVDL